MRGGKRVPGAFRRFDGERFGRLRVWSYHGKNKWRISQWLCECDCGEVLVVSSTSLTGGCTQSCGCLSKDFPHGTTHGGHGSKLYAIWVSMRNRCNNAGSTNYKWYGGRGVKVCSEWNWFPNFQKWALANGYAEQLTIDRVNGDGNYGPDNCRWSTMKEQNNNRRDNLWINIDGQAKTIPQWSDLSGVSQSTIWERVRRGDAGQRIIRPVDVTRRHHRAG